MSTSDTLSGLDREASLLREIAAFQKSVITRAAALVDRVELRELICDYEAVRQKRVVDLGFNIFAIVSDLYYRENFHSDLLRALLDPTSKHGDGDMYFKRFLDFLIRHGAKLDCRDYQDAIVVREEGRIDLLIRDQTSHKAIILENKINGAADMPRQLPRYVEYAKGEGLTVDAIAFLRLEHRQHPDKTGWTEEERSEVEPKLICLSAYDESRDDLLNGWLSPCERDATNLDARHIFKQYRELLTQLGRNVMNKPIMEAFYKIMLQGENYTTALGLKAMLDDLVPYRVERLSDLFKNTPAPFQRVFIWKTGVIFEVYRKDSHLKVDLWVEADGYIVDFLDQRFDGTGENVALALLEKMSRTQEFERTLNRYRLVRKFGFPNEEDALLEYVTRFKQSLAGVLSANSASV